MMNASLLACLCIFRSKVQYIEDEREKTFISENATAAHTFNLVHGRFIYKYNEES